MYLIWQISSEALHTLNVQGEVSADWDTKYVLLLEVVPPQYAVKEQQTPNPDAQVPELVPPMMSEIGLFSLLWLEVISKVCLIDLMNKIKWTDFIDYPKQHIL